MISTLSITFIASCAALAALGLARYILPVWGAACLAYGAAILINSL